MDDIIEKVIKRYGIQDKYTIKQLKNDLSYNAYRLTSDKIINTIVYGRLITNALHQYFTDNSTTCSLLTDVLQIEVINTQLFIELEFDVDSKWLMNKLKTYLNQYYAKEKDNLKLITYINVNKHYELALTV